MCCGPVCRYVGVKLDSTEQKIVIVQNIDNRAVILSWWLFLPTI